jgi:hypothetical protein
VRRVIINGGLARYLAAEIVGGSRQTNEYNEEYSQPCHPLCWAEQFTLYGSFNNNRRYPEFHYRSAADKAKVKTKIDLTDSLSLVI